MSELFSYLRGPASLAFVVVGDVYVERSKIVSISAYTAVHPDLSRHEEWRVALVNGESHFAPREEGQTLTDFVRATVFPEGGWS